MDIEYIGANELFIKDVEKSKVGKIEPEDGTNHTREKRRHLLCM